jgi:hypothetical protein
MKTIGYFPAFYPDELLCSAVARYRVHTMAKFQAHVNRELYGNSASYTSVALPRGLRSLHERIGQLIGMSAEELAYRTTLYPYYAAFANKDLADRMLEKVLQQREGTKMTHNVGWAPLVPRIKVCLHCIDDDIKRFGESYWRRAHQLDCVHFCDVHGLPLLEAINADTAGKSIDPLTPQVQTRPYLPYLSEKSKQRLLEMACLARKYLDGSLTYDKSRSRSSPPREFRQVYSIGRILNLKNLRRDLINYFGDQGLEILDIKLDVENKMDWLRNLFDRQWAPVKHIALELFYQGYVIPRSSQIRSRGYMEEIIRSRAWCCQNPAASHFGQEVVTNVYPAQDFLKNGHIMFKCSCGYRFQVQSRTWNCRSEPTVEKVYEFGDLFVAMVHRLSSDGVPNSYIARRFNVNEGTIGRMLRPGYNQPRPNNIFRNELKFAKRLGEIRRMAKKSSNLDIQALDIALAKKVTDAVTQILDERPPKQASAKHILEIVGISADSLFSEPYYPKTLSAIQHGVETAEHFRQRRVSLR